MRRPARVGQARGRRAAAGVDPPALARAWSQAQHGETSCPRGPAQVELEAGCAGSHRAPGARNRRPCPDRPCPGSRPRAGRYQSPKWGEAIEVGQQHRLGVTPFGPAAGPTDHRPAPDRRPPRPASVLGREGGVPAPGAGAGAQAPPGPRAGQGRRGQQARRLVSTEKAPARRPGVVGPRGRQAGSARPGALERRVLRLGDHRPPRAGPGRDSSPPRARRGVQQDGETGRGVSGPCRPTWRSRSPRAAPGPTEGETAPRSCRGSMFVEEDELRPARAGGPKPAGRPRGVERLAGRARSPPVPSTTMWACRSSIKSAGPRRATAPQGRRPRVPAPAAAGRLAVVALHGPGRATAGGEARSAACSKAGPRRAPPLADVPRPDRAE